MTAPKREIVFARNTAQGGLMLYCAVCREEMLIETRLRITTMPLILNAFNKAHASCRKRKGGTLTHPPTLPNTEEGVTMKVTFPEFEAFARGMIQFFVDSDVKNYYAISFQGGPTGERYEFIMQKVSGETPANQNVRLRKEIEELTIKLGLSPTLNHADR